MVGPQPTLDVVIVSYNSAHTLPRAIASLKAIPPSWSVRLHLHDNSADTATIDQATRLCASIGISFNAFSCPDNCGFGAGCNRAASDGSATYLLFLNPDAEILTWPADWIPKPGIYGPRIIDSRGQTQQLHGRSRTVSAEMRRIVSPLSARPKGHGYVSGASLFIDRRSFDTLGGFDQQFFMYYEDIDLGTRAHESGIPVHVQDNWVVLHMGGVSAKSNSTTSDRSIRESARSSVYYHRKHGHNWQRFARIMATYFHARATTASVLGRHSAARSFETWRDAFREELKAGADSADTGLN